MFLLGVALYEGLRDFPTDGRQGILIDALQEMERISKEPVSDKELEAAKKYLVGSFPMRFDTQAKLVNFLTQVEYYGLGLDYPEKYPSLIDFSLVVAAPFANVMDQGIAHRATP
jgi:zinc protease